MKERNTKSTTVFTVGTRATVYHTDEGCGRLERDDIESRETTKKHAQRRGLELCAVCDGEWEAADNVGGNISKLERILRDRDVSAD